MLCGPCNNSEDYQVCFQSLAFIELMSTYGPVSVLSIFSFTQQPQIFFKKCLESCCALN